MEFSGRDKMFNCSPAVWEESRHICWSCPQRHGLKKGYRLLEIFEAGSPHIFMKQMTFCPLESYLRLAM